MFGFSAHAAPKAKKTKPVPTKPASDEAPPEASDDSASAASDDSKGSRSLKKIGLQAMLTPVSDFFLAYGAGGTYNLSPRFQLGLQYLGGSKDMLSSFEEVNGVRTTKAMATGMAVSAFGRYFFGNSFSMFGGLGYRTANIDFAAESISSGESIAVKLDVTSIIIPIGLGNHWAWNNGFTVGVDWAIMMVPVSGTSTASTTGSTVIAGLDDLNNDVAELGKTLANASTLTLCLLQLGFAF